MKAGPKPYRCWFYGCHTFEYTVATDWRSVACRSGEGNIKLGQLHSVEPLFSLRWAPKSPVDRMRLWMDFITCHEGQTDVKVSLDDMIDALEDGIPLRVRIRTTPHGCTLRLLVTVEAIGLDGEPMAERAARCTTFPGQLDRAGSDALRFKIGAYRKNEGDTPWSKMKISYTDIRIDGTVLSDSQLQDAKEI